MSIDLHIHFKSLGLEGRVYMFNDRAMFLSLYSLPRRADAWDARVVGGEGMWNFSLMCGLYAFLLDTQHVFCLSFQLDMLKYKKFFYIFFL